MNFFKKPLTFLAIAILGMPVSAFCQYVFQVEPFFNYFRDPGRYELSGNFVLPQATFEGVVRVENGGYYKGDSTAKRPLTGTGIGGSIGLSVPVKATGHISCWAVAVQLMGNMYTWNNLNQKMGTDGSYVNNPNPLSGTTTQIGLPLGVEWKSGCDAILTKRLGLGTGLGAGFIPQITMTTLSNINGIDGHMAFGCTPYLKAEGAFFIGMCVKVRAMYTLGDIALIDVNKAIPTYTDGPFKFASNGSLILSLVIMPFSGGWSEWDWYNTHDTYNQHDRLN
jgi:hypothetical protein